jgi:hypothetical protein
MADSPFPSKASEKRTSLAEMAARAAQRTSRPPPAPSTPPSSRNPASLAPRGGAGSYAPPPASYAPQSYGQPQASSPEANGSGLINLNHISQAPTLAPAVRPIDPRTVTPATPVGVAAARGGNSGTRMVLAGVVVALVGIGVAYGLTSQNGSNASSAALSETPAGVQANAIGVAPVSQPKVEAPAAIAPAPAAVEKATVNTAPGTIAPAEATEITRAAVAHGPSRVAKARKGAAATNGAAATGPSPGAAAIAAAVAAEAPAAAPAAPAHPPAAAPAPAAPAAPEPTGLVGAIKKAAGHIETGPGPEKAAPAPPPIRGDIPDRPAQGAVTGALGAPRAAARTCLAGQDAPSRATVVFASTGKVQSVTVSGPAAGTPAEACIKTALSKTVVGPFKEATSSITVTITPP